MLDDTPLEEAVKLVAVLTSHSEADGRFAQRAIAYAPPPFFELKALQKSPEIASPSDTDINPAAYDPT
jgi:hypothetical protein